jgi:hypothetical protein
LGGYGSGYAITYGEGIRRLPEGCKDFDEGAAKKYVLNPPGYIHA